MSNRDRARLDIACKLALNSVCRSKHGAVIFKSGRLISMGINKSRLNNSYVNWWGEEGPVPSEHSECAAIRNAMGTDLTGAVMYVARVNKSGEEMMSRPCNKCAHAIINSGIKTVVYTI